MDQTSRRLQTSHLHKRPDRLAGLCSPLAGLEVFAVGRLPSSNTAKTLEASGAVSGGVFGGRFMPLAGVGDGVRKLTHSLAFCPASHGSSGFRFYRPRHLAGRMPHQDFTEAPWRRIEPI